MLYTNLKHIESAADHKKTISENENVYWAHYYIASEYYRNRQFKEAFDQVNLSIGAFLKENFNR